MKREPRLIKNELKVLNRCFQNLLSMTDFFTQIINRYLNYICNINYQPVLPAYHYEHKTTTGVFIH